MPPIVLRNFALSISRSCHLFAQYCASRMCLPARWRHAISKHDPGTWPPVSEKLIISNCAPELEAGPIETAQGRAQFVMR
jgi:hypothetical protein